MLKNSKDTCVDSEVGVLLADQIAGALKEPGREADLQTFVEHVKVCRKCRETMVDNANDTVLMPTLRQLARERGLDFDEMLDAFAQKLTEMKAAGKLPSK